MLGSPETLLALLMLSGMEIILGIDNIIFISIIVSKLPKETRDKTRRRGIALALVTRLLLLLSITWVMNLKTTLFVLFGHEFSGRDLILILGGLFLVAKATFEIHDKLESGTEEQTIEISKTRNGAVLLQIAVLDIVFSLDSVITAIGMANEVVIMILAMFIAVAVMMISSKKIGDFVERHPTIKILALAFLLLIGFTLAIEGMGVHVNKGYIYFAMFFSLGVELLNMKYLKKKKPVQIYLPKEK